MKQTLLEEKNQRPSWLLIAIGMLALAYLAVHGTGRWSEDDVRRMAREECRAVLDAGR